MKILRLIIAYMNNILYGIAAIYLGGIEDILSLTFSISTGKINLLNNTFLAGCIIGALLFSTMFDGRHRYKIITLLILGASFGVGFTHFPATSALMFIGELMLGICTSSNQVYTTKLIYEYFPQYSSKLIPLTQLCVIVGATSIGLIESTAMHYGFLATNDIILILFITTGILKFVTSWSASVDIKNITPKASILANIIHVLQPVKNLKLLIPMICLPFTNGVSGSILFVIISPIIFLNTNYASITSVTFFVKGLSTLAIGLLFTRQLATTKGLTAIYLAYVASIILLAVFSFDNSNTLYLATSFLIIAVVSAPITASTICFVVNNSPPNKTATVAGCSNLVNYFGVFLAGIIVSFLLPSQTGATLSMQALSHTILFITSLGVVALTLMAILLRLRK